MQEVDLFVIGAGSGGVRAARMSAGMGARVAVAEGQFMGGTCVNVGCIPKKLYSFAAHYRYDFEDSHGFGWEPTHPDIFWDRLRDNKQQEIRRLNGIYQGLLEKAGAQVVQGRATLVDAHTVQVGEQSWRARHILVATGGWPRMPQIPGAELAISSNEIFDLDELPKRILVVGGGYIAVEFASIFAGLGSRVTLCYRGKRPLNGFDGDVQEFFTSQICKYMETCFEKEVSSLEKTQEGIRARFNDGQDACYDQVLFAIGRVPNTQGLGLESAGVKLNMDGSIPVNEHFQTQVPSIYAVGDVVGRMALTPVALAEGMVVADHLFGKGQRRISYENIATAVFSHPNVATVGLSEEAAAERCGDDLAIFKTNFRHLRHTLSGRDARTFMKVVVQRSTDKVLGIHIVGDEAGEILQGFAAAMQCGLTKAQLDSTIGIHPTAAEELVTLREEVARHQAD